MPKEKVKDIAGTYDMLVSWKKSDEDGSGYVQLGVETSEGHSLGAMLEDAESGTTAHDFFGLWGTLDAPGVNRLIKVLRRAKQQAF